MLVKCPFCGADTIPGAIRCGNCARILVRNKQEVAIMRQEMGKIASSDKPLSPEEQKFLNSWMEMRKEQELRRASLGKRVVDMLLNSFIGAMAILAVIAIFAYVFVYFFPDKSLEIAQNWGLVRKEIVVMDF